ncbi:hypothetical protein CHLNCDRAFT_141129 [Chlorella variabilis]|uniref:Armadillo repeat-containing domain-containing protein n=1 Tax=Chlorella variabilis TaxID=554065 RepID=E1ZS68_CHLVA|nr:hypothetical protein CHLNCDRAFT_141129 [Chlorella variabilis]EFN51362.1 hypothetical protein CHLNCDRAFT_141129 [Chlorella variabilis]|eukprot:XP_005843464.1 hypothetical protein CHLNCDRAFT_141129 [Chlorella variabilis]
MASATYIAALLTRLRSGDGRQAVQAARTLVDLCVDSDDNRAAIVAAGGIPALAKLIRSSDASEDFLQAAARLLHNLSAHSPANAIAAVGGIPAVVQLLRSTDSEELQIAAAQALGCLSVDNPGNKAAIGAAGAIPLLVQLLRSTASEEVQVNAAKALGYLSVDSPDSSAAIAAAGGIAALQQLLYGTPSEADARQHSSPFRQLNLSRVGEDARAAPVAPNQRPALRNFAQLRKAQREQHLSVPSRAADVPAAAAGEQTRRRQPARPQREDGPAGLLPADPGPANTAAAGAPAAAAPLMWKDADEHPQVPAGGAADGLASGMADLRIARGMTKAERQQQPAQSSSRQAVTISRSWVQTGPEAPAGLGADATYQQLQQPRQAPQLLSQQRALAAAAGEAAGGAAGIGAAVLAQGERQSAAYWNAMRGASWTEVGWQNILPVRLDGQKDPSTHLVLAEVVRGGDEDSTDLRFSMKAQGAALVACLTCGRVRGERWQPVKPSRCRQAPSAALPAAEVEGRGGS